MLAAMQIRDGRAARQRSMRGRAGRMRHRYVSASRPRAERAHHFMNLRCAWIDISTPKPASRLTAEVPP